MKIIVTIKKHWEKSMQLRSRCVFVRLSNFFKTISWHSQVKILNPFNLYISDSVADFNVITDAVGRYSIQVNNETWLNSGPTFFRANKKAYSSSDGSLKLLNPPVATHGLDTLGPWHGDVFNYSLDGSSVMTNVRIYEKHSAAVFTQVCSVFCCEWLI